MGRKKEKKQKEKKKKNRIARFFGNLILLIILAGVVFYFGWVQLKLDAGEYGVIYTKTHGWEDTTLENGQFEWRWQALIPTNLTMYSFKVSNRIVQMSSSGQMPSGDLYSSIIDDRSNFDWKIEWTLKYHLKPELLPYLLTENVITDSLEPLYDDFESKIKGQMTKNIAEQKFDKMDAEALQQQIQSFVSSINNYFEVADVSIISFEYPDMELYAQAKDILNNLLAEKQKILLELEGENLRQGNAVNNNLDILSRYANLLKDNPQLLEFLKLPNLDISQFLPPSPQP